MSKINKESPNPIDENQKWLQEKFPSCFVEGKLDFDKLKELTSEFTDDGNEKFTFSWAGRADSIKNIQTPTHGTLIPQKDESINFDDTENIFIEGENLEVLKLLQKSYTGKVKMIYIDPPYNTGNDFIYKDDFKDNLKSYLEQTGQSEDGIKLTTNTETSGRFHSDWISFMYPRLFLARELLKDDGFIFVSIDDHEVHNLRLIMNQIFGEDNFVADLAVVNNLKGRSDEKYIATAHEHMLIYRKTESADISGLPLTPEILEEYDMEDERGKYRLQGLRKRGSGSKRKDRPNLFYTIWVNPKNSSVSLEKTSTHTIAAIPKLSNGDEGRWRWQKTSVNERKDELIGKLVTGRNEWDVFQKDYLLKNGEERKLKLKSFLSDSDYSTDTATTILREIFNGKKIYDNPKSPWLIRDLIQYTTMEKEIILDFFAGSGTTAHALLDLDRTDEKERQFICIQLPETIDKETPAHNEGFHTIAEICKERIRRVIKQINYEEKQTKLTSKSNQDLAFKVFKLAKSNYKIWENVKDEEKLKDQLKLFEDPLVENYKNMDVIYEIIIKEGYSLNSEITEITTNPNKIYKVSDGEFFFYVTLDGKIDEKALDDLNLDKNIMFVCLDLAISDSQKINLDNMCKLRMI